MRKREAERIARALYASKRELLARFPNNQGRRGLLMDAWGLVYSQMEWAIYARCTYDAAEAGTGPVRLSRGAFREMAMHGLEPVRGEVRG